MSMGSQKQSFSPLLYFLENNKHAELVRVMMNKKVSEEYLTRYGKNPEPPIRRSQEARIQDYLSRFDLSEIVHLKGSHPHRVKQYTNFFLEECFRRKLKLITLFTPQERLVVYPQLTEQYQLPTLFAGLQEIELPKVLQHTIQKDVTRTYISQDLLQANPHKRQQMTISMRKTLTTVLEAFAKYNPFIGYCQGMNNLILFLIQEGFTAEQSFFILKKMTEELLPCDYYSTMNSVLALVKLFCEMLAQTHPQAVQVMKIVVKNNGGDGITLTTGFVIQWFICLFTNTNLNRDIRRSIMDHFIIDGIPALLKAALCFFDTISPAIVNIKHFQHYNPKVEGIIRSFNDLQLLQKSFNERYINKPMMELLMEKLRIPTDKRRKYEPKSECNWKWTTCLQAAQEQLAEGRSYQFFVFKTAQDVKVIPNYFEVKNNNYYFRIGKNNNNKAGNLRIGRMEHICRPPSGNSLTEDVERQQLTLSSKTSKTSSPYTGGKPLNLQQPEKRELLRNRALRQLQSQNQGRKTVLAHSESVMFMKQMIQNQSFSNLLEILEVEEMDTLFQKCINEDEEEQL